METDETQFLRTIRAAPHDDAPRLVYADWLEENGRAERAEFIRLQCALEAADDGEMRRPAMLRRERQLWRACGHYWRAELPSRLRRFPFRRGFVQPADLEVSAREFLSISSEYLDAAPQWTAKLFIHPGDPIPGLARSAHLERLTGLSLHINGGDTGAIAQFLAAPSLRNLRALSVEGQPFGIDHLRIVAGSPALGCLRKLGVFCSHLRVEGAEIIAASPYLRNLERLDLNGCGIGETGLRALASAAGLHHLRELNLPQNGLDNGAASAIIGSRHFKRLTALGLFGNHLGDAGARALANGQNLEQLARLDLGLNRIGPDGARALANTPFLPHLRQLYLGGNRVTDDPIAISALRTRFGERVTV